MERRVSYISGGDAENCYGCGACVQACPVSCIELAVGADGFRIPKIDETKCISCKKCVSVCPVAAPIEKNRPLAVFAAVNKNRELVYKSSSGGVFYQLAALMIEKGGVVFGAAWNSELQCAHIACESVDALPALLKSKYVQSDTKNTYREAERFLKEGRPVLYSGTPCQIAGLKQFLKKEYDNLLCVDVACHGVPSGEDLKKCIAYLEEKFGGKVRQIDFRNKKATGWQHSVSVKIEKEGAVKTHSFAPYQLPYYFYFLYSRNVRKSCYWCEYAGLERISDITLSDFWRIERIFPGFSHDKGVSCVVCNTPKGNAWMEAVKDSFALRAVDDVSVIAQYNQPFRQPCTPYPQRDALLQEVLAKGYTHARSFITGAERVKAGVKNALPEDLKTKISKMLGKVRKH